MSNSETYQSGVSPSCIVHTPDGMVPADWLQAGDMILTRDDGMQPVKAIQRCQSSNGISLPASSGVIIPNQLVLIEGWPLELTFARKEMLIMASQLYDIPESHLNLPETMISIEMKRPHMVRLGDVWVASTVHDPEQLPYPLLSGDERRALDIDIDTLLVEESCVDLGRRFEEQSTFGSIALAG